MRSNKSSNMDSGRLNKIATCSHCSQLFAIRDPLRYRGFRCPLVLPCGHSVCEFCVRNSVQTSAAVTCAVCHHKINQLREETVRKDFPVNMYLLGCFVDSQANKGLIDSKIAFQPAGANTSLKKSNKIDVKPSASVRTCSECCAVQAMWTCQQCAVVYCNQCFAKVHKAAKALQKHTKIQLGLESYAPVVQPKCKVHPDQKLEYHCKDCDEVVCPRCALQDHKNHSIWSLQERNESVLPDLKEAYDKANIVLRRLMMTRKEVKNAVIKSDPAKKVPGGNQVVQIQHAISRHFVHLHGALQMLESSLLGQLDQLSSGATRSLEQVSQEIDTYIESVRSLLDEAVAACDPASLPQCDLQSIMEKLQDAEKLPCYLVTQEASKDVPLKFIVDETFVQQVNSHCELILPGSKKFILARTDELPEGFKVEDIADVAETPSELSSTSRASSLSALSDIALSDTSSATSLPQGFNVALPIKGSTEVVTVNHIKDPSSFFVLRECDKKRLENMSADISAYIARGPKPPSVVLKDGLYVVQYEVDKHWYRARVNKVISSGSESEEDKIEVTYIDYGNIEVVPASRLRCINPKHSSIPPFAQHCRLFNLAPVGQTWTPEAALTMAAMLGGCRVMMTVMEQTGSVLDVDLSRCPTGEEYYIPMSVRDALVFLELGCFLDSNVPSLLISPTQKQFLGPETLKKGEIYDVTVTFINHPSSFYVQKLGCHDHYLKSLMEELNKACETSDAQSMVYTPKIGMACAALFPVDNRWYRVRVTGLPGNRKVEVYYVDYGNQETVDWTTLRILHGKFLRLAPQAIHCSLSDVVPINGNSWSDEANMYFLQIAMKKVMKLFVDDVLKTKTHVTLYDSQTTVDICLNALLVKNNHALSTGSSSALVEYHKTGERVLLNQGPKIETRQVAVVQQAGPAQSTQPAKRRTRSKNKRTKNGSSSDSSQKSAAPSVPESEPEVEIEPEEGRFRLEVSVLSADNPSCLYVSLTSQESVIENLMTELQTYYRNSKDMVDSDQQWKPHDKCCAFSSKEKKWYRGIIIEADKEWAKVFMKDFALVDTVPVGYLRPLAPQFMEVRDGAVKCHLAGIKAAGDKAEWPTLACEQLVELIDRYDRHFISKKGEIENFSLPIELWVKEVTAAGPLEPTIEEWVTLNWKLVDQGLAIPVRSDSGNESIPSYQVLKELKDQKQNTGPLTFPKSTSHSKEQDQGSMIADTANDDILGDDLQENDCGSGSGEALTDWLPAVPIKKKRFQGIPSYVDDDCNIYLHEVESEETLQVIQKALQSRLQGSQAKPHDLYWFAGLICIAQYHDKKWYRGKVLEVMDDNTVKVLFVDYGNIEELKAVEMRKNVYMGHIPIQCHKYRLDGIAPISETWPTDVLDFIHTTIVEKKCQIVVRSDPGDGSPPLISLTPPGGVDLAGLLVSVQYARHISNVAQVKAAIEPLKFTTKVNSDTESDRESDSASVIIEEETVKDIDDEGSKGLEERAGREDSELTLQEKEGEAITVCVENVLQPTTEVPTVKSETEEQALSGERVDVEKECVEVVRSEENMIQDFYDDVVLQARIDKLMQGTLQLRVMTDAEMRGQVLTETEQETNTQTEKDKDNVIKNYTEDEVDEIKIGSNNVTEGTEEMVAETKTGKVVVKSDTVTEKDADNIIENESEEKVADQVKKRNNDLNLNTDVKEQKLWADLLSEEEGSDQDGSQLEYETFNLMNFDELTVEVTAIISPNEVAIRPMECEENAKLIKDFLVLSMKMQEEAPYQPIVTSPVIGLPCCVCFKEDGQWYRATVLDILSNASQLKIQYVDYGNVEIVHFHEVHELKPEWTKVPLQAMRCHLWKVKPPPIFIPQDLLMKLTDCLFQPPLRARFKDRQPSSMSVELFTKNSEVPVYQSLLDSGSLLREEDEE